MTNLNIVQLYRLSNGGVKTAGVVFEKDRENHQRIKYQFSVDGQTYRWGGFSGDLGMEFDEIRIGQQVTITFEAGNPSNSCLGEPESTFYPNLRLAIVGSLLPSLALALFGIVRAFKNSKRVPTTSELTN